MRTTWLAVGMIPPAQVAELDQLPLCTDWTPGRELSAEKSGMFSGSVPVVPGTVTVVEAPALPPEPVQVRE
jgi:hypothetical protein